MNTTKKKAEAVTGDKTSLPDSMEDCHEGPPGITISEFDYSVENHFRAVDMISKLCGEAECEFDQGEIARLSSSIAFLREWKHFNYQLRTIRFACQSECPEGKDVIGGINLPQFSSATVPKLDRQSGSTISSEFSKDFVMYVGGSVWALDWCPRVQQRPGCDYKSEFIAVAAHPPESSYHKIGAPLTGRGVIQIWCLLNVGTKEEDVPPQVKKKPKQNPKNLTQPQKPRGRPRKKPIVDNLDCNNQCVQALVVQFPEDSFKLLPTDGVSGDNHEQLAKEYTGRKLNSGDNHEQVTKDGSGRKRKGSSKGVSTEAKQNPRNSEAIKIMSAQLQKPRGRPRKKPINESADNSGCNNQCAQALAVQFPKDPVKLLPTHGISIDSREQVAKEDSGRKPKGSSEGVSAEPKQNPRNSEAIKVISTQPQKPRGRPRKKQINESADNSGCNNQCAQALAVQFPEDPLKLLPTHGVSGDSREQVAKEDSGRKPNGSSKGVSAESKQNPRNSEAIKVISTQPQKPRGRPQKKPTNESADNSGCNNQCAQALVVQFPEDPVKLLPTDGVSGDTPEEVPKEETGRKPEASSQGVSAKPKRNPRNSEIIKVISTQPQKPRGRPRKKLINESADNSGCSNQFAHAIAVQFPEDLSKLCPKDGVSGDTHEQVAKRDTGKKRKVSSQGVSENSLVTVSVPRRLKDKARTRGNLHGNGLPLLSQNEKEESSLVNPEMSSGCRRDPVGSNESVPNNCSLETNPARYPIPKDIALPRVMFCLAHNGKVAWDVKWRPSNVCDTESKHRMGYLAVLLGNGALEVWEVPFPSAIKVIYSACKKEGTDPRFVKLEPVFRCSMLKCGDRQSIPLTVEWSASSPHDLILAGCHDGVVALWKFSTNGSSKDTRPLICFSADTVPIRALAWAPVESDPESANIIVTAGHKGLKFWDIRDPFRPLWDLNPVQRVIYSLDWLPDPRCVIVSFDDGTLRILSLLKAAYDVPVTGKPFVGTQQQGLHSYYCSSFTIWSVQVSRLTGMVAYCSADGTVLRFQLTTRAVEKDPLRNRVPHFLCGSLIVEESALTVITPLPDIPFPMKKSLNEWGNAPRTIRGFLSVSNQEKRAKEKMAKGQTSDEQPLALCYGDDPGTEFGFDDMVVAEKSKQAPKTKTSNKKKLNVCRDEDSESVKGEECEKVGEVGNEIEVFPHKMVAMHRVRWNMNKGSERWLCYGGAGGIVRCQEI